MDDKVICPYCGAEMLGLFGKSRHDRWSGFGFYKCERCTSTAPAVYGHKTVADAERAGKAAAMRRYTPPFRPLTLEEVRACEDGRPLYCEDKEKGVVTPVWSELAKAVCSKGYYVERDYGILLRYWPDRKPTKEEMEAAAWETQ